MFVCICGCVLCGEVLAAAANCIGSLRLGVKGECLPQMWVKGTEIVLLKRTVMLFTTVPSLQVHSLSVFIFILHIYLCIRIEIERE